MIARVTGRFDEIHPDRAVLQPDGQPGIGLEVLLPRYLATDYVASDAAGDLPERVTLFTIEVYEGQGQGTSFVPRLLGFATASDRAFFELMTSVKGLGHRKTLRAMARPPAWIAGRIASRDAKGLTELPEIGKKMGETMVHELAGKVEAFIGSEQIEQPQQVTSETAFSGAEQEAIEALVALGQTRAEAEKAVTRAAAKLNNADAGADELLAASF